MREGPCPIYCAFMKGPQQHAPASRFVQSAGKVPSSASTSANDPRPPQRILIDCAFISANSATTGIPRVVFKYIEHGYDYGRRHNLEVLPVYVGPEGVVDARYNLPSWTHDAPGAQAEQDDGITFARVWRTWLLQRERRLLQKAVKPIVRILSKRLGFLRRRRFIERARGAYHRRLHQRTTSIGAFHKIVVGRGDILFMPAFWHDEPPSTYAKVQESGALLVPLLHDVLPITLPAAYNPEWRELFRQNVVATAVLCDHLMYVSESTRNDFRRVLSSIGGVEPPYSIHHNGFDFSSRVAAPARPSAELRAFFSEPGFRALMVGTVEPKKNHLLVLAACQALWAEGLKFKLALVGRPGWQSEEIDDSISKILVHKTWKKNIAWFTDLTDEDLEFAYSNSQLCILASAAEGFGIPLIEALAKKVPVLASDIPPFREIGDGHATFFDLKGESALADALRLLIEDPKTYDQARRRAETFRWPDWATLCTRTFDQLLDLSRSNEEARHGGEGV